MQQLSAWLRLQRRFRKESLYGRDQGGRIQVERQYTREKLTGEVSVAMRNLRENGHITVDGNNHIHLTDKGMSIAARIYERHKLLTALLVSIGVDADIAEKDACRVEHDLSPETFEAIRERCRAGKIQPKRRMMDHIADKLTMWYNTIGRWQAVTTAQMRRVRRATGVKRESGENPERARHCIGESAADMSLARTAGKAL